MLYHRRAAAIAVLVTAALVLAIVLGSRNLGNFDAAPVGYAVATVFAVLGITYRFARWLARPPTLLYWLRGWQFFLYWCLFRRYMTLIPRAVVDDLAVQSFILPHPINEGRLCPKGVVAYQQVNHPDRLLHPMIRRDGRLQRASWDEAP